MSVPRLLRACARAASRNTRASPFGTARPCLWASRSSLQTSMPSSASLVCVRSMAAAAATKKSTGGKQKAKASASSEKAPTPKQDAASHLRTVDVKIPTRDLYFEHSEIFRKFVNCLMYDGKKSIAERILRETLFILKTTTVVSKKSSKEYDEKEALPYTDPREIVLEAIENVKPVIGLTPVRKSGAVVQVPYPLSEKKRTMTAIKWIIAAARAKKGSPMSHRLATELQDALKMQGGAIRKKVELHKTAEANRAFANLKFV